MLEAVDGVGHRHGTGVDADGDRQPGDPHKRLHVDADGKARIFGAEALLGAELLGVVGPAFDER